MTDEPQIKVNATPTAEQIAAGIRQLLLVLSTVAGVLGSVGWAGKFNALAAVAGPLAALIVIVIGQFYTVKNQQAKLTMAKEVDDSVAIVVNKDTKP